MVKVCGVTSAEDATAACRSGANLIGCIFAKRSKRKVSRDQAKEIVHAVRQFGERECRIDVAIEKGAKLDQRTRALQKAARRPMVVGVFQDDDMDEINEIVDEAGLDLVQLHGDEGWKICKECQVGVIRVINVEAEGEGKVAGKGRAKAIMDQVTSDPVAVLLDTSVKGVAGGAGVTFDWDIAKGVQGYVSRASPKSRLDMR